MQKINLANPHSTKTPKCAYVLLLLYYPVTFIHFIAPPPHFPIYHIFQCPGYQTVFISHHRINKGQITHKIFFISLQQFFPFYVVTLYALNDKCSFQSIQIVINSVDIHLTLLTLKIISDILCIQTIANIVKNKLHNSFQQLHITDAMSLYRIAQNNRRINIIYKDTLFLRYL